MNIHPGRKATKVINITMEEEKKVILECKIN
jgi:hypothetical protein